jgi:hypothetical protein
MRYVSTRTRPRAITLSACALLLNIVVKWVSR